MTADDWSALYTNPGDIAHPLDGAELPTIIEAALKEQRIAEREAIIRFLSKKANYYEAAAAAETNPDDHDDFTLRSTVLKSLCWDLHLDKHLDKP